MKDINPREEEIDTPHLLNHRLEAECTLPPPLCAKCEHRIMLAENRSYSPLLPLEDIHIHILCRSAYLQKVSFQTIADRSICFFHSQAIKPDDISGKDISLKKETKTFR